jgi:predicted flavoprotein YhiN
MDPTGKIKRLIDDQPKTAVEGLLRSIEEPEPQPLAPEPRSMPDVAVIGAGAAGLTAALRAAQSGARVVLLNAHPKVGLKILMSGGTRCNVTHEAVSERDFNGGSRNVIARILRAFDVPATLAWFEDELDVPLKLEESGKYFPVSDDAQTVLDALLAACNRAGARIENGARVVRIERDAKEIPKEEEIEYGADVDELLVETAGVSLPGNPSSIRDFRLGIQTVRDSAAFDAGVVSRRGGQEWTPPNAKVDRWVTARRVILASGGLSFPRTGSDGAGYSLAAACGHTIVPPVPALTPLTSDDPLCRDAQGVTIDAELALWAGGKRVEVVRGSLLIAHFGFSGPAALDLSRHWLRAEGERRVTANFAPGETHESMMAAWLDAVKNAPERTVRRQLGRWVPERIASRMCVEANVNAARTVPQVSREQRSALIAQLLERDLRVTGTLGYEKAEVTAGGVALNEVDASTLGSRLCPGLYLCGEILDVEGRLGGFNFQWSWSSGTVAGRSAGR